MATDKIKIKSRFLTDLDVRSISDSTWELISDLRYESKLFKGIVVVPSGFVTDFSSVPRLPFIYYVAGGVANKPAVVHDFLYQKHFVGKMKADRIFMEAMNQDKKIPVWKRWVMYSAVVAFGWAAYSNGVERFQILNVNKT